MEIADGCWARHGQGHVHTHAKVNDLNAGLRTKLDVALGRAETPCRGLHTCYYWEQRPGLRVHLSCHA